MNYYSSSPLYILCEQLKSIFPEEMFVQKEEKQYERQQRNNICSQIDSRFPINDGDSSCSFVARDVYTENASRALCYIRRIAVHRCYISGVIVQRHIDIEWL